MPICPYCEELVPCECVIIDEDILDQAALAGATSCIMALIADGFIVEKSINYVKSLALEYFNDIEDRQIIADLRELNDEIGGVLDLDFHNPP